MKLPLISTHSLTRRLTIIQICRRCPLYISTHSLTRRLTEKLRILAHAHLYFNSQPHKEADTKPEKSESPEIYFNSQPHKEADHIHRILCIHSNISTHSLTRRLTGTYVRELRPVLYFNSQPHKEADDDLALFVRVGVIFQLTASQGG